jgi:hypothetical protein
MYSFDWYCPWEFRNNSKHLVLENLGFVTMCVIASYPQVVAAYVSIDVIRNI